MRRSGPWFLPNMFSFMAGLFGRLPLISLFVSCFFPILEKRNFKESYFLFHFSSRRQKTLPFAKNSERHESSSFHDFFILSHWIESRLIKNSWDFYIFETFPKVRNQFRFLSLRNFHMVPEIRKILGTRSLLRWKRLRARLGNRRFKPWWRVGSGRFFSRKKKRSTVCGWAPTIKIF